MTQSLLQCCTNIIRSSALVQASFSLSMGRTRAGPRGSLHQKFYFRHFSVRVFFDGEDCDGVDRGGTHARLYDDAQNDNDDDNSVDILEAILRRVGQLEDAGYDDNGVDVSVGVDVGAGVGVGVNIQSVSLGVVLSVSLVEGLPSLPSTLREPV